MSRSFFALTTRIASTSLGPPTLFPASSSSRTLRGKVFSRCRSSYIGSPWTSARMLLLRRTRVLRLGRAADLLKRQCSSLQTSFLLSIIIPSPEDGRRGRLAKHFLTGRSARNIDAAANRDAVGGSVRFALQRPCGVKHRRRSLDAWHGVLLLDNVGQLVGQQALPGHAARCEFLADHDVASDRVRSGADGAGRPRRLHTGVQPDGAEVVAEAGLHRVPGRRVQRLATRPQHAVHQRRRVTGATPAAGVDSGAS
jgi:hypothetical protein